MVGNRGSEFHHRLRRWSITELARPGTLSIVEEADRQEVDLSLDMRCREWQMERDGQRQSLT